MGRWVAGGTGARRLAVVVVATLLLAAGCGRTTPTATIGPDGGAPDGTFAIEPWTSVRPGPRPGQVTIAFQGPDPSGGGACVERHEAEVAERPDGAVAILLKAFHPRAATSCPTTNVDLVVDLGRPLDGRQLEEQWTGHRHQLVGDRFELVAGSTPCGRADCSAPSPMPAPCETAAVRDAVDAQIDGGIRRTGPDRCDGTFLVVGIDTGSGGCPPVDGAGPSPCARPKLAYFVAREGTWSLVTYGEAMTCAEVEDSTSIRFPAALCG